MNEKEIYRKLEELEINQAVLNEKVKRIEGFIYGGLALILLDIVGMLILWIKDIFVK